MKYIKHIFFDLDHTLWDYEKNAFETVAELLIEYQPHYQPEINPQQFYAHFSRLNAELWVLFREHKESIENIRRQRVTGSFRSMKVPQAGWMHDFSDQFLERCPQKTFLMAGTRETLTYLSSKYALHIITNGLAQTQLVKLQKSGIDQYFDTVTCCDEAGFRKPHPGIFEYALQQSGARQKNSLYIGDNYHTDVKGGIGAGIETIFYHPGQTEVNMLSVQEIQHLVELQSIL